MSVASFAEDTVNLKGCAFEFGDHVDGKGRAFSLTSAEFLAANPVGTRVEIGFDPIKQGHYSDESAFAGMLGEAFNFEPKGKELLAEFAISSLLAGAIRKSALKMSAIFGAIDKKLIRIDVVHPSKAVIKGARFFARDDAEEVEIPLAEFAMMPEASRNIAFPTTNMPPAVQQIEDVDGFDSPVALSQMQMLQHVHAMGMQHIHDCCSSAYPDLCEPSAHFARYEGVKREVSLIHKASETHGAKCSGMKASFSREDQPVSTETTNDNEALLARIAALETENRRIKDKAIMDESVSFARDNADRIAPPAQPLFAALYRHLAEADTDEAVVEFAYGKDSNFKGTGTDLLKTAIKQLSPHGIGVEKVRGDAPNKKLVKPDVAGIVHFAMDDTPESDPTQPTPDGQTPSPERIAFLKGQATAIPATNRNGFGPLPSTPQN